MKVISIGRSENCDIVYDDNMISRRHAMLRVYATGKMELIDMSSNGTTVNKTRVKSNVPFPVSRKDVIRFAGTQVLDWKKIPNPLAVYRNIVIGVVAVALLIGLVVLINQSKAPVEEPTIEVPDPVTTPAPSQSSTSGEKPEVSDKSEDKAVTEFINAMKQDEARKREQSKQNQPKKEPEEKQEDSKEAESQTPVVII